MVPTDPVELLVEFVVAKGIRELESLFTGMIGLFGGIGGGFPRSAFAGTLVCVERMADFFKGGCGGCACDTVLLTMLAICAAGRIF